MSASNSVKPFLLAALCLTAGCSSGNKTDGGERRDGLPEKNPAAAVTDAGPDNPSGLRQADAQATPDVAVTDAEVDAPSRLRQPDAWAMLDVAASDADSDAQLVSEMHDSSPAEFSDADDLGGNCSTLQVVFRDFRGWTDSSGARHPDFEQGNNVVDLGIPDSVLGSDLKPRYGHGTEKTATVQNADSFGQWYRDTDGTNIRMESSLPLAALAADAKVKVFDSSSFFPLDGKGWGNQGQAHNYSFTTEIHAVFTYRGGERLTFRGDDDVFIYLNKKLVLDLGGIGGMARTGTVQMDEQNLEKGVTYSLDFFHAERHVVQSSFRLETRFECLRSTIVP